MDTNRLKRFAQETRRKILEQVTAKLDYVLTSDTPELREKAPLVNTIKEEIARAGKNLLIDKVAYTWFNRLIALRYMDCNDYQPLGIKIISPLPNQVSPQILQEAIGGHISDEMTIDKKKVLGFLNGSIKSKNAENDAYRLLLIAACNHLNRIFPFLFERIDDFTELLLPDDLTSEFSVLHNVTEGMTCKDCSQVEVIGWLYQFYISEKKDEVFASKEKVKKEDIPAATQLFTSRWIVEYMVQNTVGKIWMMNHPDSNLRQFMPYYIETEASKSEGFLKLNSPEELTLLDQACGSGHILVYGFELLYKIYEEQGYNPSEIPGKIISNNLFGFEIDERATQLSGLAVLLKAREYQPRLFKKSDVPVPNITCFQDLELTADKIKETFKQADVKLTQEILHDLVSMQQATNLGSLIRPITPDSELVKNKKVLLENIKHADLFDRNNLSAIVEALNTLIKLGSKYTCIVDNPPYMGSGKMNPKISEFVKVNFPNSKADLFSCFIDRALMGVVKKGFVGMVTMESWMFLSSFEEFRKNLIDRSKIHSLSHFGWHIMRIAFGTVSFILENAEPGSYFTGVYSYMENENISKENGTPLQFPIKDNGRYKIANQKEFGKIPGSPIGYWLSDSIYAIFKHRQVGDLAPVRKGNSTSNNQRFLRFAHEISKKNHSIGYDSIAKSLKDDKYWIPYNKGGGFRKWYGNQEFLVFWKNDAADIRGIKTSVVTNEKFYMKPGLTWSTVTSSSFSLRWFDKGFIFDNGGCCLFIEDENLRKYILGAMNGKVFEYILSGLNPTLNFQSGEVSKFPIIIQKNSVNIDKIVDQNISIAKEDWDKDETSWNFSRNELIRISSNLDADIETIVEMYQQYWKNRFQQLQRNEEELNKTFIEIYALQHELSSKVEPGQISLLKNEAEVVSEQLIFDNSKILSQFISYAVGCMFGRYSLDKEGLILANQGNQSSDYYRQIGATKNEVAFTPDEDNIIPVLEDEWFEDDIVNKFYQFLKVSFGEKNFRRNVEFLEEQIGIPVRKYFIKDFYTEHIQRFKKRPIYWMFSSPKGHFNVLIYLHRYTADTLNNILNSYLREFIEKLKTRKEQLKHIETTGSASEKTKSIKEMDKIELMLADCYDYERNILYPLATERIEIDLDNGVLVNYNCFGKAVKEVKGLNDAKTKAEVKKFDWIHSKIIR